MKETDIVLRTLVDAALSGRRSWKNVADLAWEAHVGDKIAYKTLGRATSIGAIAKHPVGGFSVTDPERILAILSARRTLSGTAHQLRRSAITAAGAAGLRDRGPAAVHHLGGPNRIADHAPAIVYVPEDTVLDGLPEGDDALIMVADSRALQSWTGGYTSKAQTYADLFAQPGWQASEFRRALWRDWFAIDDWTRAEMTIA